mgnify:CR=1 FL=1
MATLQSNRVKTSHGRLRYIFETEAHDGSAQRVLGVTSQNCYLLHDPGGTVSVNQSAAYLQKQFARVQARAKNHHKTYKAESIILSFSDKEFPLSNDIKQQENQVKQSLKLTTAYARAHFPPGSQWVAAVQRDGKGHKLHVHLLVNTVQITGKVVRTCNFHIPTQRKDLNDILKSTMPAMGLTWDDPQFAHAVREDVPTTNISWQEVIKNAITGAIQKSTTHNIDSFISALALSGISIKISKRGWTYKDPNGHRIRDFYQHIDKKTGEVKSTRGLGRAYTANNLIALIATKKQTKQQSVILPDSILPDKKKKELSLIHISEPTRH